MLTLPLYYQAQYTCHDYVFHLLQNASLRWYRNEDRGQRGRQAILVSGQLFNRRQRIAYRIRISLPRKVDERRARDVYSFDAHSLQVVKRVQHSQDVSSMTQLRRHDILLKNSAIGVIIGRVGVHKSVQKECVEWKSPILRRRMEVVVLPFTPIVERMYSILLLIEIVVDKLWIISQSSGAGNKESRKAIEYGRHIVAREMIVIRIP